MEAGIPCSATSKQSLIRLRAKIGNAVVYSTAQPLLKEEPVKFEDVNGRAEPAKWNFTSPAERTRRSIPLTGKPTYGFPGLKPCWP